MERRAARAAASRPRPAHAIRAVRRHGSRGLCAARAAHRATARPRPRHLAPRSCYPAECYPAGCCSRLPASPACPPCPRRLCGLCRVLCGTKRAYASLCREEHVFSTMGMAAGTQAYAPVLLLVTAGVAGIAAAPRTACGYGPQRPASGIAAFALWLSPEQSLWQAQSVAHVCRASARRRPVRAGLSRLAAEAERCVLHARPARVASTCSRLVAASTFR